MLKTIITVWSTTLILANYANGQTNNNAEQVANKIAKKMKDTLNLTAQQRQQVFQVNMQLHQQKQAVRQQYSNLDTIQVKIQAVERSRDSLYYPILGQEKYQLYLQKKRNLVNNN